MTTAAAVKAWKHRNPEKVAQQKIRWRKRHPDYMKNWRRRNPDKVKRYRRAAR